MKRYFAIIITLVAVLTAKAGDVNLVNGIWYDIDVTAKTASVVANPTGGKYVGEVNIPSTIDWDGTVRVTSIGASAFQGSTLLTKVTMTSQITSIGNNAFYGCTDLVEISGYTNVSTIGQSAFNNCSKLTDFHIYSALSSVGKSAFNNCTGIQIVYGHDMDKFGGIGFSNNNDGTINSSNPLFYGARLYVYDSLKRLWYQPMKLRASYSGTNRTIRSNTFINNKFHTVLVVSGITEIGLAAFRGSEMEELILPSSVTDLKSYCFAGCTKLKRVSCAATTPPSVASQRPSFYDVELSKVKLYVPSSSVSAYKAHSYWKNFGSIEAIPETVDLKQFGSVRYDLNSTGSATVVNFDATTLPPNVHIPDFIAYNGFEYRVTSIADFALQNCELSTLDLPTDISYIGSYAFQGCQNLVEVFMDKDVALIGSNPFKGCTSLQKVRITAETPPSSLNDWENISTATLEVPPSSVSAYSSTAPWSSFSSTSALTGEHFWYKGIRYFLNYDGTASVTGFNEEEMDEDVVILSHLPLETNYTVTSIADRAFQSGIYLQGSRWEYYGGGKIKSVQIPGSVKTIGESALQGCKSLQSVVLCSGIESIGESAFSGTGLISVNIPGSVKRIGVYAFSYCESLSSITLNYGIEEIDLGAFYYCSSLTSVILPASLKSLGDGAFVHCAGITSLNLPASLTIEGNPFSNMENLQRLTVSAGNPVLSVEDGVLYETKDGDKKLVQYPTAMTNTPFTFTVPDGVTVIGNSAFEDNHNLAGCILPESLKRIGNNAFWQTIISSITIPSQVTEISYNVFGTTNPWRGWGLLSEVTIEGKVEKYYNSSYMYSFAMKWADYNPNPKLRVPVVYLDYYLQSPWTDWFAIIEGYTPEGTIATSINSADSGHATDLSIYNLHGQRVSHPVKGQIYIQNGRKVKF